MKNSGFSLVELSIVLVILGLLAGGILTGQSLIRAAELRSVTTEFSAYQTAVRTFQDKYFAIPGDMRNATDFWGSAGGDGYNATCAAVASTTSATCNGNGDGSISTAGDNWSESYRAWQHLANAGLIEGQFTGAAGGAGWADATPGVNQPSSKISASGWTFWTHPTGWANFARGGTGLWYGADGAGHTYSLYPILTPQEAWNIDNKLDDGKPAHGKVSTMDSTLTYSPNCTGTTNAATAEYRLDQSAKLCNLIFWLE